MDKNELYPLKFTPILKERIWGGTKLKTLLNKPAKDRVNIGESWEISGVEGDISIVSEGEFKGKSLIEMIDTFKGALVGDDVYEKHGNTFPLLIKFIDANADLSIQVHPDDHLAKKRHNSFGKTEMWYVVEADEQATLINGFNRAITKEEYKEIFESGNLEEILNVEAAKKDDVFFIPAGRVHTIGKGLLIAEIQQTSDITYRIYDFNRKDSEGNKRELHIEESLDAIDYTFYEHYRTDYHKDLSESEVLKNEYFATTRILTDGEIQRNYSKIDSCIIIMCLDGQGKILYDNNKSIHFALGDTIMIPNSITSIRISTTIKSKFLEVYIPN